jgi:hypothetical protein
LVEAEVDPERERGQQLGQPYWARRADLRHLGRLGQRGCPLGGSTG